MKKSFTAFLVIGFFTICSAVSANAQTVYLGKYYFEQKLNYDRESRSYQSFFSIFIELKNNRRAIFTKIKSEEIEVIKRGYWTVNKEKIITVTFPPGKTLTGEKYVKVIITFKKVGKNLKEIKVSPTWIGSIGNVYKKI